MTKIPIANGYINAKLFVGSTLFMERVKSRFFDVEKNLLQKKTNVKSLLNRNKHIL